MIKNYAKRSALCTKCNTVSSTIVGHVNDNDFKFRCWNCRSLFIHEAKVRGKIWQIEDQSVTIIKCNECYGECS